MSRSELKKPSFLIGKLRREYDCDSLRKKEKDDLLFKRRRTVVSEDGTTKLIRLEPSLTLSTSPTLSSSQYQQETKINSLPITISTISSPSNVNANAVSVATATLGRHNKTSFDNLNVALTEEPNNPFTKGLALLSAASMEEQLQGLKLIRKVGYTGFENYHIDQFKEAQIIRLFITRLLNERAPQIYQEMQIEMLWILSNICAELKGIKICVAEGIIECARLHLLRGHRSAKKHALSLLNNILDCSEYLPLFHKLIPYQALNVEAFVEPEYIEQFYEFINKSFPEEFIKQNPIDKTEQIMPALSQYVHQYLNRHTVENDVQTRNFYSNALIAVLASLTSIACSQQGVDLLNKYGLVGQCFTLGFDKNIRIVKYFLDYIAQLSIVSTSEQIAELVKDNILILLSNMLSKFKSESLSEVCKLFDSIFIVLANVASGGKERVKDIYDCNELIDHSLFVFTRVPNKPAFSKIVKFIAWIFYLSGVKEHVYLSEEKNLMRKIVDAIEEAGVRNCNSSDLHILLICLEKLLTCCSSHQSRAYQSFLECDGWSTVDKLFHHDNQTVSDNALDVLSMREKFDDYD